MGESLKRRVESAVADYLESELPGEFADWLVIRGDLAEEVRLPCAEVVCTAAQIDAEAPEGGDYYFSVVVQLSVAADDVAWGELDNLAGLVFGCLADVSGFLGFVNRPSVGPDARRTRAVYFYTLRPDMGEPAESEREKRQPIVCAGVVRADDG